MDDLKVIHPDDDRQRENLLLFGGAALVLLGAGLLVSSVAVRSYLRNVNFAKLLQAALPEVERYLSKAV